MSYPGEREGKVLSRREVSMIVQYNQLTVSEDGTLVTEASTIGLAPGQWPVMLSVVRDGESVGSFRRVRTNGDVSVVYEGADQELHVLND